MPYRELAVETQRTDASGLKIPAYKPVNEGGENVGERFDAPNRNAGIWAARPYLSSYLSSLPLKARHGLMRFYERFGFASSGRHILTHVLA
jgi:hypothetical protein